MLLRDDDRKQIPRCARDDKSNRWFDLSIVAPARGTIRILARVRLFRFFGEEAAYLAAADAAMRPQSFEDHFGGGGNLRVVLFVFDAEAIDVVQQVLDIGELPIAFGSGGEFSEF